MGLISIKVWLVFYAVVEGTGVRLEMSALPVSSQVPCLPGDRADWNGANRGTLRGYLTTTPGGDNIL